MKTKTEVESRIRELCGPLPTAIADRAVIAGLAEKNLRDIVQAKEKDRALAAVATINLVVEMRGPAAVETDEVRNAIWAAAQVSAGAAGMNGSAYENVDAEILASACVLRNAAVDRLTQERGGPGPGLWLQALREAGEKLPECIDVAGLVFKTTGLNLNAFIKDG